MANIVFTGYETRGKELHKLLENLGGVDAGYMCCSCVTCYYYINREGYMECSNSIPSYMNNRVIMSLEEFERRYPYKVGDKVNYIKYNDGYPSVYTIQRLQWTGVTIEYLLDSRGFSALTKDLQPYKEAIVGDKATLVEIDLTKELEVADEVEVILGDYEFVLKDGKTYFVKKKPKYPKTYEECCKVLLLNPEKAAYSVCGLEYKRHLIVNLQRLIICRDAYWKIAGDWKPDVMYCDLYCIGYDGNVITWKMKGGCRLLVFPTEEMRDAFYENFKELIEECKEVL